MRDEDIEQFHDVLQNIESAIVSVYDKAPDLLDLDVIDALDAAVRRYVAEQGGRTPPKLLLAERALRVYEAVERMCEWMLGRSAPDGNALVAMAAGPNDPESVEDILNCLKRIRKSVRTWNERGGRQGYLDFVGEVFRGMGAAQPAVRRFPV
jgi:hypothetical protein